MSFATNQIIDTASGDTGPFEFKVRSPGTYAFSLGGTFASRTFALQSRDRSGNITVLDDPDGTALSAVAANVTLEVSITRSIWIVMDGTGDAVITVEAQKLW